MYKQVHVEPQSSCRASLEEAVLALDKSDRAHAKPENLEQEIEASNQIARILVAFLSSKWETAISRSQISISESKAPLSLDEIQEVMQRKHDLEKLDRCISTLVKSVQRIPGLNSAAEEVKSLKSHRNCLKRWADQLEKISQSLLGMLAVEESIKANEQAIRSKNLQLLAYIFIPISTVSSIYGMNTKEISDSPPRNWYFLVGAAVAIIGSARVATLYHSVRALWFAGPILQNPWTFMIDLIFLALAFLLNLIFLAMFPVTFVAFVLVYSAFAFAGSAVVFAAGTPFFCLLSCWALLRPAASEDAAGAKKWCEYYGLGLVAPWTVFSGFLFENNMNDIRYYVKRGWELLYFFDVRHPLTFPGPTKSRRRWIWTRRRQAGPIAAKAKKPPSNVGDCVVM